VCNDMSLAKDLELSPYTCVSVLGELAVHTVWILQVRLFAIDPYLDLECASAIVESVCDVCRLLRNISDLTYKRHLCCFGAINHEVFCIGMRVFGVEKLFDRYWA